MPPVPSLRLRLVRLILMAFLPGVVVLAADTVLTRQQVQRTAERVVLEETAYAAAMQERWLETVPSSVVPAGAVHAPAAPAPFIGPTEDTGARSAPRYAYFDSKGQFLSADPGGFVAGEVGLAQTQMDLIRERGSPASLEIIGRDKHVYLAALASILHDGRVVGYVSAVVPREQALAAWSASLQRRLGGALLAICAGLLLAWWLLERWVVRDLLALKSFSESVQADPDATPPPRARAHETADATDAVVTMAGKLHRQQHRLLELHAELREANATLEKRVHERTQELERNERLYRNLAEAIPQMVWYGTAAEGLTYVNRAWRECLGLYDDEPIGFRWVEAVHPDDRERAVRLSEQTGASGEPFYGQFRMKMHDGEYRHYLLQAAPLDEGEYGPYQVWAGVGTDVTELKKSEESLQLANSELESFSYSVSHDLRAPLVAINGFSSVLLDDYSSELDRQARHYLERIQASSVHMAGLIDDLLKLAQFSVMEAHRVPVDFSALCEEVVAAQREGDPQRGVDVDITPGMLVWADRRLLRIVLTNLVGNAWKFTRHTSDASVRIGCRRMDGETVYHIRDNGAGFDMRHADKLFGVFQRLHGKQYPGTGIGLATVWRIVRRHGGRIWAEASPGDGASFYFTLPGQ